MKMKALRMMLALTGIAIACSAHAQITLNEPVKGPIAVGNKPGNPLTEMPDGQHLISPFGERPVFSPDGRKIAFIADSYGDAYEYDMATGKIRNLTAHMAHRGFLRIHYLADGSYLLLGPRLRGKTAAETRESHIELFWMNKDADQPPVALGVTVWEGIATSRLSNRVAWGELAPAGASGPEFKGIAMKQAEVVVDGAGARLANVKDIATINECWVEAQDFLPGDKGLTMPCYHIGSAHPAGVGTEVLSIDFATKKITRYPTPPELYGEVEAIFPDSKRTLVECSSDRAAGMDLCILELKADRPKYTRLTHIMDYGRWKYGNPVISPDGKKIASSIGPADVPEPGMALGIVLIDLPSR